MSDPRPSERRQHSRDFDGCPYKRLCILAQRSYCKHEEKIYLGGKAFHATTTGPTHGFHEVKVGDVETPLHNKKNVPPSWPFLRSPQLNFSVSSRNMCEEELRGHCGLRANVLHAWRFPFDRERSCPPASFWNIYFE